MSISERIIVAVRALDSIEVSGKQNVGTLYNVMDYLEKLAQEIGQENNNTEEGEG